MKKLLSVAICLCVSGCASLLEIVDNQSIETSHMALEDQPSDARIVTIDGARRLVRSDYDGKNWVICAETQADALSARRSKVDLALEGRGTLGDEISEALTTTYTRTELSDAIRQLSWQICNSKANGYIGDVEGPMKTLISESMLVLQLRANTDTAALLKAKSDLAALSVKLKNYQECIEKADGDKTKIAACKANL